MNDTADDQIWFDVADTTPVTDESGTTIGQLVPGKRYRALEVGPVHLRLPGPRGAVGLVPRSAARLEQPVAPDAGSQPTAEQSIARQPIAEQARVAEPGGDASSGDPISPAAPTAEAMGATQPSSAVPPPQVPPGWMPDPEYPGIFIRYWDGFAWTEHRAAASPGGVATHATGASPGPASADATATTPLGRPTLARAAAVVALVWMTVSLYRLAAIVNFWGDSDYGYFDETSVWWVASTPWVSGIGDVGRIDAIAILYSPADTVWLSPYWMLTFAVGLFALWAAIAPNRRSAMWLMVMLVVHVVVTTAFAIDLEFPGETVRIAVVAAIAPIAVIVMLAVARKVSASESSPEPTPSA